MENHQTVTSKMTDILNIIWIVRLEVRGGEGGGGCRKRDVSSHSPLAVRVRLKEHIFIIHHYEKANKYDNCYRRSALNKSDSPYLRNRLCIRRPSPLSGVWVSRMHCKAVRIWWVRKVLIKTRVSQSNIASKPPILSDGTVPTTNDNNSWSMLKLRLMGVECGGAVCNVAVSCKMWRWSA